MYLIDGSKILKRLESYYDNQELLPDPRVADLIKMVNEAPMAFDLDNLLNQIDQKIRVLEENAAYAEDAGNLFGMRLALMFKDETEKFQKMVMDNIKTDNEHYS